MTYYDAFVAKWGTLTSATPEAKLAEINTAKVAGPDRPVPIADVMTYLRSAGLWLPIKAAATGTCLGAAAAVDLNNDMRMQTIDMGLSLVAQMLTDLITHNLLNQTQADALVAMKNTTVLWWQSAGYAREFDMGDVQAAGVV